VASDSEMAVLGGIREWHTGPAKSQKAWHTDPGRWKKPRIYHTPFDKQFSKQIHIGKNLVSLSKTRKKTRSKNRAYWFAVSDRDTKRMRQDTTISVLLGVLGNRCCVRLGRESFGQTTRSKESTRWARSPS